MAAYRNDRQAVRASGAGDIGGIAAVVLETDGSLSVITGDRYGNGSALQDVTHPHERPVPGVAADGEH